MPVDPKQLEALLWAQCSNEEAAAFFAMTEEELQSEVENSAELTRIMNLARLAGKAAMKKSQFDSGVLGGKNGPDAKMLMHLGEQHLGQVKRTETYISIEQIDATIAALEQQLQIPNGEALEAEFEEVEEKESGDSA